MKNLLVMAAIVLEHAYSGLSGRIEVGHDVRYDVCRDQRVIGGYPLED